jgi:hypothetical protein
VRRKCLAARCSPARWQPRLALPGRAAGHTQPGAAEAARLPGAAHLLQPTGSARTTYLKPAHWPCTACSLPLWKWWLEARRTKCWKLVTSVCASSSISPTANWELQRQAGRGGAGRGSGRGGWGQGWVEAGARGPSRPRCRACWSQPSAAAGGVRLRAPAAPPAVEARADGHAEAQRQARVQQLLRRLLGHAAPAQLLHQVYHLPGVWWGVVV